MKRLLIALMLLVTATAASAEWTRVGSNDDFDSYTLMILSKMFDVDVS